MKTVEGALVDAVAAALPILSAEREFFIDSNTVHYADGEPDLDTLNKAERACLAEYDHAIRLCQDALKKAGVR